jgi:hypothetical protein
VRRLIWATGHICMHAATVRYIPSTSSSSSSEPAARPRPQRIESHDAFMHYRCGRARGGRPARRKPVNSISGRARGRSHSRQQLTVATCVRTSSIYWRSICEQHTLTGFAAGSGTYVGSLTNTTFCYLLVARFIYSPLISHNLQGTSNGLS